MFSTQFRVLGLATLALLASLTVSSCLTPPDYSDTPEIDFKSIQIKRVTDATGTYDTVTVTVSFRDGDGDLGLSNDETNPPYQYDNGNNRYNNNYFFEPQILNPQTGIFNPVTINYGYDSRYPRLTQSERKEPLRGELSFGLKFSVGSTFARGSTVRFKVSIADRALHESNTVLTDPVTFN